MIKYTRVNNIEHANDCDKLLTKMIKDSNKYNDNANQDYIVKSYYKKMINKDGYFLYLATDNKIPVGYIFCYLKDLKNTSVKESVALIDAIYVDEEYRRQGIATDLINSCKSWCDENDIKYLDISVCNNNEEALKLYEKLGFTKHTYIMSTKL